MKVTAPLYAMQLRVMRWVAAGCPDGVMTGSAYKTSAMALHHRKLMVVSRKGGSWSAKITPDGEYYLAKGEHRPRPVKQATPSVRLPVVRSHAVGSGRAREPEHVPPGGKAAGLVAEVVAAGGRLVVDRGDRRNLSTLVQAANRFGKVPPGTRLASTWTSEGTVVYLEDLPEWARTAPPPVAVPAQLRRPHPAVAALRGRDNGLGISGTASRRALLLLNALAQEAVHRGYVATAAAPRHERHAHRAAAPNGSAQITITIRDNAVEVHLTQEHDKVPHRSTKTELRDAERRPWMRVPEWDRVPTERLSLTLQSSHRVRQDRWTDSSRSSLDVVLGEVLREVELRCAAAEAAQVERERQAEQRRLRWEAAREQAQARYVHAVRREELHRQAAAYRTCSEVGAYVQAMEERLATLGTEAAAAAEWITFAQQEVERLDPLRRDLRLPAVPEPSPQELQPFLAGWSAYGPN